MYSSTITNTTCISRCLGGSKNKLTAMWLLAAWLLTPVFTQRVDAQEVKLVSGKQTTYSIVLPEEPTAIETKAAKVLQQYIQEAAGVPLPVVKGNSSGKPALYLGNTKAGGTTFRNTANVVPVTEMVIPAATRLAGKPTFEYREIYYPASMEGNYLEWNKLQQFTDLWGLWGHSYDKLVPAHTYFRAHPEYYAMVKGKRQATQLCLSNETVYRIVVEELKKRMAANTDAVYWSVSPNDDNGYCQCDQCAATDSREGGPQGSLIAFVNKVAANFPDKKITTLAYGYTHKPSKTLKPAGNVYIFLSDIDGYRDKPLATEPSARNFRDDLKGWGALTPNLFVWDYVTQFTNYLAPFPNFQTLQANMRFFVDNGVKGLFIQGSGETNSEFAELRSFLLAKLLNDPNTDIKKWTDYFLNSYYGPKAGPMLGQYLTLLQNNQQASHRKLDIYGNPVNEYATWLSPDAIDKYSTLYPF
ncbi:MAG: DUF4838 domain-containing protein [Chitinophagia bacterium]|nr:DUF4838 domain-containing protein [Chitinophagia bacterium]